MKLFVCSECGRYVTSKGSDPLSQLCKTCVEIPGWFKWADLRRMIDHEHDGIELMDDPTAQPPRLSF